MIVLDTNVVSQLTKKKPNATVMEWLNTSDDRDLLITAITVAELHTAVELLTDAAQQLAMAKNVEDTLDEFGGVCLAFDGIAAAEYADIVVKRRRAGRPMSIHDAQIAAIARSGGFALATLNTKDFEGIDGLKIIDPSIPPGV